MQCLFLLGGQVDYLLGHLASPASVFLGEELEGIHAKLVVGETEEEPQREERAVEVEHAVVERKVLASAQIVISEGCMPVKAVNFVAWCTSQQTDFYGVRLLCKA